MNLCFGCSRIHQSVLPPVSGARLFLCISGRGVDQLNTQVPALGWALGSRGEQDVDLSMDTGVVGSQAGRRMCLR